MLKKIGYHGILLFLAVQLSAQPIELKITSVGKEKGLSNSNTTSITQDSSGYIWIGTEDGLNRFDGFEIVIYRNRMNDGNSLPHNWIRCLYTDSGGTVWIGTDNGLCYFQPQWNRFRRIVLPPMAPGEENNLVEYISEHPKLGILFSIGNKLYIADFQSGKAREYLKIDFGEISSFLFDKTGNLWVGAFKDGGLYQFDQTGQLIRHFRKDAQDENSLSSNSVLSISLRNEVNLWIATENAGINRLNIPTGEFTRFPYNTEDEKYVRYTYVDRANNLWVGDVTGIKLWLDQQGEFFHYYTNPKDIQSIRLNAFKIFQDIQDNYWILYHPGGAGVSIRQKGFKVFTDNPSDTWHTMHNSISAVHEDSEGNLWLANPFNGIDIFHWIRNETLRFRHDPEDPGSLGSGSVCDMKADTGGMWVGTHRGGLQYIDSGLDRFVSYRHDPEVPESISGNFIRGIFPDSKGNIWVAVHGVGVDRFDREEGVFHHYTKTENNLSNEWTYEVIEDHLGNIWVATKYGLSRLPEGEQQFVNYFADESPNSLNDNQIITVYQDSLYRVWIGTSKGLNLYNREKDHFISIGGALKDKYICSILDDNNNTLWIGTLNGLYNYDPASGKIRHFDESDGLPTNEFEERSCYRNLFNDLFFGTRDGVILFDPNDLNYNKTVPKIIISNFRLFNREITNYGPDQPLDRHISFAKELHLRHDQNMISFEFMAISMIHPEKNNYAYKLEGFDDEWHYIGDRREATYTNLDPGEYIFRVKASNNDGIWNERGASIKVIVYPPWWQTIWFRASVILAVIVLFFSIYFLRITQLKRQKVILEKKVKQSTLELQDKNRQLIDKSNHLNEVNTLLEERQQEILEKSVKLQELNTSKDRLFSIIAHDLTSPFNAILGFTEMLNDNYAAMDADERRQMAETIHDSAKRVYGLLDNLLNWARAQTNRIKYEPEKLDMENVFRKAMEVYRYRIERKQIAVKIINKTDKKPYADRDMVDSIVRNLLGNATKYTPAGGQITVTIEQDNQEIRTSLIDTGIGMEKDVYNNLFNLDKSESREGTEGEKGSGIGLILANEFIGLNGGTLTIRSKEGEGSTFSFTLPVSG